MIFHETSRLHLLATRFFKHKDGSIRRQGFFPTKNPKRLHNCKQYFWIAPDGVKTHAAYLNTLEEDLRETVIVQQYLSHATLTLLRGELGWNVLERDNPWDFRIGLSTGATINVEITSVTDREGFFRKLANEELVQRHSYYPKIRLGILKKIANSFPDSETLSFIEECENTGMSNSEYIDNPFFPEQRKIFLSTNVSPMLDLKEEIKKAVRKKQMKSHSGKDETVLIIDNRTSTSTLNDFLCVYSDLKPLLDWCEFFEIWLYTGYGGGHNQRWEDYLILPLKLDTKIAKMYLDGLRKKYKR